jgi:hypothetical protein
MVAVVALAAAIVLLLPYARRVLLGWYVHEVQQTEVAETPDEAIVTYPLA